ncbi:MAG: hypothetical protein GC161_18445 [Planctomycetaceae bacterium]|nr:hypothetical protein [Planctomycetaceae bacterium]
MHLIDGPFATVDNEFTPGNPGGGVPATKMTAAWCNALQFELKNAIEGAGLSLDKPDNTQLLQAIQALTGAKTAKDACMNGAFDVWQRGVTFACTDAWRYTADRWRARADGTGGAGTATVSQVATTVGDLPVGARYFLRFNQTNPASVAAPRLEHTVEDVRRFAEVDRCLSLWLRATGAIDVTLLLIQTFGPGGSGDVTVASQTVTLSGSFQRFHVSDLLPTVLGKTINEGSGLVLALQLPSSASFQVDVACAQLEPGLAPSTFELRDAGAEEARCWRYYEQSYDPGVPPGTVTYNGAVGAYEDPPTGLGPITLGQRFRASKRIVPTLVWWNPETGTQGEIVRLAGSPAITNLAATPNRVTRNHTGQPITSASAVGRFFGQWTANAEF